MRRAPALLPILVLAACKPPAADDYVERTSIGGEVQGPSEPIDSPDTEGAVWAPADKARRLLYGKPGERPLFAIECAGQGTRPMLAYTRFAKADPHAKAVLALIGNSHVTRLPIDATQIGDVWRWEGAEPVTDPRWPARSPWSAMDGRSSSWASVTEARGSTPTAWAGRS